jgi:hydroxypyruvate isomerase
VRTAAKTYGLAYAPNISWLLPELPFAERPRAIAEAGFGALEFGFPSHADLDALEAARQEWGLEIVLFNQDVPVWDAANRGYLVDRRRREEFRRRLDEALLLARRLGALKVMLPAGVEVPGMAHQAQHDCMVENLRYSAPLAAQASVLLTIEVINPIDNPGYFLTSSREALDVVREVGHPSVRFQYDTYHLQRLEGNLASTLRDNMDWIGHIQFADAPGRHEPGTGAIDFGLLAAEAEASGYRGYIGLEYNPLAEGLQALAWVPEGRRTLPGRQARRQARRQTHR